MAVELGNIKDTIERGTDTPQYEHGWELKATITKGGFDSQVYLESPSGRRVNIPARSIDVHADCEHVATATIEVLMDSVELRMNPENAEVIAQWVRGDEPEGDQ